MVHTDELSRFVGLREFLIGAVLYGAWYHCGMCTKGYIIGSMARKLLSRWYQIESPEAWLMSPAILRYHKAAALRICRRLRDAEMHHLRAAL